MTVYLAVHLAPIANPYNKDAQSAILYIANDPVIPNPVLPELAQLRALESLADTARIIQHGHALTQKTRDAAGKLLVQLG